MAVKDKAADAVEDVKVDVEAEAAKAEGLVAVFKNDVRLFVHDALVDAHAAVGWVRSKF